MKQQNKPENLKRIGEMVRKGGTPLFFMAVSHLFECGVSSFTEESYAAGIKAIEENHRQAEEAGHIRIMTPAYEKSILDQAYQLSQLPLFDILLYIKKNMEIYDPEAVAVAEAEDEFTEEE